MINITEIDKTTVNVSLIGELTIYVAKKLNQELESIFNQYNTINIDMKDVLELDTSCYQILLRLNSLSKKNNKKLTINTLSEQAKFVFQLYDRNVFTIKHN